MRLGILALLVVSLVACKKDAPPQGTAPTAAPAPPTAAPAAPPSQPGASPQVDPNNPLQALQQLGQALSGQKGPTGPVVNWRSLEPFVPAKWGDWTAEGDVRGNTGGLGGMQVSQVRRTYKTGDRRMRAEIVDTTASPFMRAGFAFAQNINEDSSTGIKKGTRISGNPAIVEWRKSSNRSRVSVLVGDRYLVKVSVSPASNPEEAAAIAGQMNLAGLASLK